MEFGELQEKVRKVFFTQLERSMTAAGFYLDEHRTPHGKLPHNVHEGAANEVLQDITLSSTGVLQLIKELNIFSKSSAERDQRQRAIQLRGALEVALCCSEVREQLGIIRLPSQIYDMPKRGTIYALYMAAEVFLLE